MPKIACEYISNSFENILQLNGSALQIRLKKYFKTFVESMIPAQDERWRRGLGMQAEREVGLRSDGKWRKGE